MNDAQNHTRTPNGYIPLHRSKYHNHIALKEGKVFIYDDSGRDPDETDDGPLYVAEDILNERGGIKVNAGGEYGPTANIPVRDRHCFSITDQGQLEFYSANVDLEGAIKIGRRLGLKVDMVTNIYDPKTKK